MQKILIILSFVSFVSFSSENHYFNCREVGENFTEHDWKTLRKCFDTNDDGLLKFKELRLVFSLGEELILNMYPELDRAPNFLSGIDFSAFLYVIDKKQIPKPLQLFGFHALEWKKKKTVLSEENYEEVIKLFK